MNSNVASLIHTNNVIIVIYVRILYIQLNRTTPAVDNVDTSQTLERDILMAENAALKQRIIQLTSDRDEALKRYLSMKQSNILLQQRYAEIKKQHQRCSALADRMDVAHGAFDTAEPEHHSCALVRKA